MCAVAPEIWTSLRASLSPDLRVTRPLPLAAIPVGCKLLRYAHTPVSSLSDLPKVISSRRVWVQVSNPLRPVVNMRTDIAASTCPFRSLFLRPLFVCEAFADACAGLGGYVRLPDGRQACFACSFTRDQLANMFSWFPSNASPQHCIAAREMLVHVGLLWTLSVLLPPGRVLCMWFSAQITPLHSLPHGRAYRWPAACANSCVPSNFCRRPSAFPCTWTTCRAFSADALSRGIPPSSLGFRDYEIFSVPWTSFPATPALEFFPSADLMSAYVSSVS